MHKPVKRKDDKMKKKSLLTIIISVLSVILICTVLVACSNKGGGETTEAQTDTVVEDASGEAESTTEAAAVPAASGDVIYTENGVDIKSVSAELVGESETLNLSVVFANNNSEEVEFDCSKFEIRAYNVSGEEAVYKVNATSKTFAANQSYIQWAFTVDSNGEIKVGDSVIVYFDGNAIDTVEVAKF